jgi:AraC family transcriptional regulator of adaptative response / DNA-3-methyladenine glycosylase II
MNLDSDICYRAIKTRDARFDGQFFTAVCTTGIYCRPICPAPTPKQENCRFFPSAAAAQMAGFRPCLRCRPELSPGLSALVGTTSTVVRALELIAEGALDQGSVAVLAARLGVGDRHLRQLFAQHLGTSPSAVAQTRRLLFAKQLIDETSLSMTDVAIAAGFASIRRFNEVIQQTYQKPPKELRRLTTQNSTKPPEIKLKLPFSPPFNWAALVHFLAPRATPGIESVGNDYYRRSIVLDGVQGAIEVRPVQGQNYLVASICFPKVTGLTQIVGRLHRLFDLNANVAEIAAYLQPDPKLSLAIAALPGLRIPGAWDNLELAVRAILGQQVSVAAATTLAGRLVETYGEPLALEGISWGEALRFVFPRPEVLATADLSSLGIPRPRAFAIASLAAAVAQDPDLLQPCQNLEDTVQKLCKLPGIGEWTAQYIAMRALREPDAFPATDLGLLRSIEKLGYPMTKAQFSETAQAWRPWRAYAAMYLWSVAAIPAAQKELSA